LAKGFIRNNKVAKTEIMTILYKHVNETWEKIVIHVFRYRQEEKLWVADTGIAVQEKELLGRRAYVSGKLKQFDINAARANSWPLLVQIKEEW
jgi:hypothetical protein